MLGRLEMNIDDCIDAFTGMMDEIFHRKHKLPFMLSGNVRGRYSSETLEKCIKQAITDAGFPPDTKLRDQKTSSCKVYVYILDNKLF
jgi:calcium-independent phospholipase A2-gamma